MQLEIYHWLAPLISMIYIIRTIKQYSAGKYSPRNAIVWVIFWIGVALLGIMPNEIANSLSKGLGFRDAPNAIIFVALGLLFLMVFYLSAALNRVENQLTELVREIALKEIPPSNQPKEKRKVAPEKETNNTVHYVPPVLPIDNSAALIKDIEELENIVNDMLPSNVDENNEGIPNESKTPKSNIKE